MVLNNLDMSAEREFAKVVSEYIQELSDPGSDTFKKLELLAYFMFGILDDAYEEGPHVSVVDKDTGKNLMLFRDKFSNYQICIPGCRSPEDKKKMFEWYRRREGF
jgi:hypothetical protein